MKIDKIQSNTSTQSTDGYDSDKTILIDSSCNSTLVDHTYTKCVCTDPSISQEGSKEDAISTIFDVLHRNRLEHDYFDKGRVNDEIDDYVSPFSVATEIISSDENDDEVQNELKDQEVSLKVPDDKSEKTSERVIENVDVEHDNAQGVEGLQNCDESVASVIKDDQNNDKNREVSKKLDGIDDNVDDTETDEGDAALKRTKDVKSREISSDVENYCIVVSDVESCGDNDNNGATDCESSTSFTFNFKEIGNFLSNLFLFFYAFIFQILNTYQYLSLKRMP